MSSRQELTKALTGLRIGITSPMKRHWARFSTLIYQFLFGILLINLWQYASGRWIDPFWISSPLSVGERLAYSFISGEILPHLFTTLAEAMAGYITGGVLGVSLGFCLSQLISIAKLLDPYIMAFNGIPRIALAPLVILWFGIGLPSKIILATLMVFFVTFFNTYSGANTVDPDLTRMMKILGSTKWQIMIKLVVPYTSPWTIAALRVSIPYALVGAVVGEFIAANRGLGYLIQLNSAYFDTTGALANIITLAMIVLVANNGAIRVERRLLRWKPSNEIGDKHHN